MQDYFRALPMTNGNAEAITALADCAQVTNSEKWEEYLTKWLVAVVANAMDLSLIHIYPIYLELIVQVKLR